MLKAVLNYLKKFLVRLGVMKAPVPLTEAQLAAEGAQEDWDAYCDKAREEAMQASKAADAISGAFGLVYQTDLGDPVFGSIKLRPKDGCGFYYDTIRGMRLDVREEVVSEKGKMWIVYVDGEKHAEVAKRDDVEGVLKDALQYAPYPA